MAPSLVGGIGGTGRRTRLREARRRGLAARPFAGSIGSVEWTDKGKSDAWDGLPRARGA